MSALRFASLGSGSKGNATVVQCGETVVLIDCGFSAKEAVRRLERLGLAAEQITAVLVTHEHGDHVGGVGRLSRRFNLPVYLTSGTLSACKDKDFSATRTISPHQYFSLGPLDIQPFPVPHDARDPCQFVFSHNEQKLGLLTDAGSLTPHIVERLSGCDALMLECNYDPEMLENGPYPPSLCRRIDGRFGHLANHQSEELLNRLDTSRLRFLQGMHVSEKNNQHELALKALHTGMDADHDWIAVACQEQGFNWLELD